MDPNGAAEMFSRPPKHDSPIPRKLETTQSVCRESPVTRVQGPKTHARNVAFVDCKGAAKHAVPYKSANGTPNRQPPTVWHIRRVLTEPSAEGPAHVPFQQADWTDPNADVPLGTSSLSALNKTPVDLRSWETPFSPGRSYARVAVRGICCPHKIRHLKSPSHLRPFHTQRDKGKGRGEKINTLKKKKMKKKKGTKQTEKRPSSFCA